MTEKTYHIFLVVRPGLEQIAKEEIIHKYPHLDSLEMAIENGGIEMTDVPLNVIYTLQYNLKTLKYDSGEVKLSMFTIALTGSMQF